MTGARPAPGADAPQQAALAALASLPDVGPARLRALLARGAPADVLRALACGSFVVDAELAAATRRGDPRGLVERWSAAARELDVGAFWAAHVAAGVAVLDPRSPEWPAALVDDPEPPAVLFGLGRLGALVHRPAVAVVGTRRCSRYGWDVAHELGTALAGAGVTVVSGLADGIDAAAHRGALDAGGAPPVGVVATGLDVPYPWRNRNLWAEVAAAGVVVSEAALGTRPARWRFPARNRVIAALADAVVVVESAAQGGAMHTVDEALRRDRPVFAVPGPVNSPASVGTNRLLADAALPLCDLPDLFVALGLPPPRRSLCHRAGPGPVPDGDAEALAVLEALGPTEAGLDAVAAAAGLDLGRTAAALARLEAAGAVVGDGTCWHRSRASSGVTR